MTEFQYGWPDPDPTWQVRKEEMYRLVERQEAKDAAYELFLDVILFVSLLMAFLPRLMVHV